MAEVHLLLTAATVATPLLVALGSCTRRLRWLAWRCVPWAAVPAFALALCPGSLPILELPWLLLVARLGRDSVGGTFLLFSALLWILAGWYARAYLAADDARDRFARCFLLTMAGNLGLIVAQDVATFYLCFATMTFAAYGLVVHVGGARARRAGRVYLTCSIVAEALRVAGLLLAVKAAGSTDLGAVAAAAASGPSALVTRLLLFAGFAVKAALLPLHVWLPLAHPIAPTPASAVLSGAMIKAGVFGWLRLLPGGLGAFPELGAVCALAGALGAAFAGAVGLTQRNPKALLAYSSIGQMGFLSVGIGIGLIEPGLWGAAAAAVALYAMHHGLAKAALFLGAGLIKTALSRRALVAGQILPALALAGAPFTSGALAKFSLKEVVGAAPDWLATPLGWLLSLAAAGTTLLMARLLCLTASSRGSDANTPGVHGGERETLMPWFAAIAAVAVVPWWFAWESAVVTLADLLQAKALVAALWPVVLGGMVAFTMRHRLGERSVFGFVVAPGDLLGLVSALALSRSGRWALATWRARRSAPPPPRRTAVVRRTLRCARRVLVRAERALLPWPVLGGAFLVLVAVLFVTASCAGERAEDGRELAAAGFERAQIDAFGERVHPRSAGTPERERGHPERHGRVGVGRSRTEAVGETELPVDGSHALHQRVVEVGAAGRSAPDEVTLQPQR